MSESKIRWPEMASIHSLLLCEQLLGSRLFRWLLGPLKAKLLQRISRRFVDAEVPIKREVERVVDLSPQQFRQNYFNRGRAVIISGAAKRWPCCEKWNLDYFSLAHGDGDLLLVDSPGLTTRKESSAHEFLSVRDLISNIRSGGDRYLRFSPLLHERPELANDLDLQWLGEMRGGGTFGNTYYMFMGGKGQKTFLHNDQPCNLYVQIVGSKKWTLIYPEDSAALYPQITNAAYMKSPVDLEDPDFENYPLIKGAHIFEADLHPGDVLYVPPHVWHQVENKTDTIAVGYRFSSMRAALRSSVVFSLLRVLSTNPPVWKTRKYGKMDTNLIWAHSSGKIDQVLRERRARREGASL